MKPAFMVRRRSTVRFRNGAPARKYDSKIWTLGSENRWGLTAARRRHGQPASASPARPCRQLRQCPGSPARSRHGGEGAGDGRAGITPRPGGPGREARQSSGAGPCIVSRPDPAAGTGWDTVRAPAADAGRRQARAARHQARVPGRRLTPAPKLPTVSQLSGPEDRSFPRAIAAGCSLMHVERAGHSRSLCQALARRGTEGN